MFFLRIGQTLQFMGPAVFPKLRYVSGVKLYPEKLVMIAGGSGTLLIFPTPHF
jgi:hypothetical protein